MTKRERPDPPTCYRSGELARLVGVSADTLRHYESAGVLATPPRTASGYRIYPASALDRVRTVRAALAVGFSLAELAAIFRDRDRGRAPCKSVRALAARKLELVEERLAELEAVRAALRGLIDDWDRRLDGSAPGEPARLLEALGARADARRPDTKHRRTRT